MKRAEGERQKDITKAAVLYASGKDQNEIASELGCRQGTISKMLNTSQAKQILEQESIKYLNSLSTISDSTIQQINTTNSIHKAVAGQDTMPECFKKDEGFDLNMAIKYCELTSKREDRILAGHGLIAGTGNQTNYVQNIYNDNRTTSLDASVLQAIGSRLFQNDSQDEIIDIE